MRIGLLGLGRIGSQHAAHFSGHPEVKELLLADADAGRAEAAADALGAEPREGLDSLLAAGLDALVIATPTDSHAEMILRACHAEVPTFCEKPVATSLKDTIRVAEAVAATGTMVHIGFQRRFDPGYVNARTALVEGKLGELRRAHLVTADPAPPPEEYVHGSGGLYRDCQIHDFDILRWVTGREVDSVVALGANRGARYFSEADDVDEAAALLVLDDGTLVTMQGSRYNGAGYDVRMELAGTEATIVAGAGERAPLVTAESGPVEPVGSPWSGFLERFAPAYAAEIDAFVHTVMTGAESPCTVDDALQALYIAEAMERSRRSGRQVRLSEVK